MRRRALSSFSRVLVVALAWPLVGCSPEDAADHPGAGSSTGAAGSLGSAGLSAGGGPTTSGGGQAGGTLTAGSAALGGEGGGSGSVAGAAGLAGGVSGGAGGSGAGSAGSAGAAGASGSTAGLVGFATLNGGTTGGQGGPVVMAKTFAELKAFAESATPQIIMVSGTIANGANGGVVSVKSNKSLIGVGSTAFLNGVGLDLNNASNIIIQNLRLSMTGVTTRTETPGVYTASDDEGVPKVLVNDGDTISIRGTSKNIWIDHCELFSEDPAVQTNHDLYDGLVDIKGQTGFITVSWCYLHDHHKGGLVGSSDTDLFADRKVTLHHNFYDNVKLRVPMYRGATGHFFNNYVARGQDASEIRADTCVRMEKNYYETLHFSIYTPADAPGKTERIDNVEVSHAARAYPTDCKADIPYPYADALTGTTNDVKNAVPAGAGVGKL
jgi:pectate lyase